MALVNMAAKTDIEKLWDLEDKFTALAGSAIGEVFPISRQKEDQKKLRSDEKAADLEDQAAIVELCRRYWRPVFSFVCRHGYAVPDAQDLTQDFFLTALKKDLINFDKIKREGFRSQLLKLVRDFLIAAQGEHGRSKKASKVKFISWDDWLAEAPSQFSTGTGSFGWLPAERLFDVRWAATVVERALHRLYGQCQTHGNEAAFVPLSNQLTVQDVDYSNLAQVLDTSVPVVKNLLQQLRQHYRALLRDEVAQTVGKPSDVDREIRYLCKALANVDEHTDEPVWSRWLADHRRTLAIGICRRGSALPSSSRLSR
jgi:DNA-directed RNA polymerase specialized sigma24 family protein